MAQLDTYAATSSEVEITIPLQSEGPHLLDIRNRAENHMDSTGYRLRFKQLVANGVADLQTIQYTYDALSRLVEARYNPGLAVDSPDADLLRQDVYTFDLAGNRLSESLALNGGTPTITNYTYNAANQISNQGFAYNANGNLTNDGVNTYTWDRANRLLSMGGVANQYDGMGRRVNQTVNSIVTEYFLDVQPSLPVMFGATANGETMRFLHTPRGIQGYQNDLGEWIWPVRDSLGSVRVELDDNLAVQASRQFSPIGLPFEEQGTFESPYAFTGEPMDGNGLVHLRRRYYNPMLGVFPSLDPMEGEIARVMSLNRYGYVEGNVANRVDPSGLRMNCPYEYHGAIVDLVPYLREDSYYAFAYLHGGNLEECEELCGLISHFCLPQLDRRYSGLGGDLRGETTCIQNCQTIFPRANIKYPIPAWFTAMADCGFSPVNPLICLGSKAIGGPDLGLGVEVASCVSDGTFLRNLRAALLELDSTQSEVRTRGFIVGFEVGVGAPAAVGGSAMLMFESPSWLYLNCEQNSGLFGYGEIGLSTPDLGFSDPRQGVFGLAWSTADLANTSGPTLNISGDFIGAGLPAGIEAVIGLALAEDIINTTLSPATHFGLLWGVIQGMGGGLSLSLDGNCNVSVYVSAVGGIPSLSGTLGYTFEPISGGCSSFAPIIGSVDPLAILHAR